MTRRDVTYPLEDSALFRTEAMTGQAPADTSDTARTRDPAAPGRFLVLSAHDYRTPRRANIHFITDELATRGHTRFFSLRYCTLSRWKNDIRLPLDAMLPLPLLKWLRTLATVRVGLSVAASTKTAIPWGA